MAKRDKSRFEKWFSFSRHKRRFGAKALSSELSCDFSQQKSSIIDAGEVKYTHGSATEVADHFEALRAEFSGQSELCYTHAKIIVLIRRDFETRKQFALFEQLWAEEGDFLLENLNTRWLISAADTFADHSDDASVRALALACACLLNTVKIQETERLITNAQSCSDSEQVLARLDAGERLPLFDGTSAFKLGTDDTLRNMRWRMDRVARDNVAGSILLEVFARLQQHDTVYKRFKDCHTRSKTGWW